MKKNTKNIDVLNIALLALVLFLLGNLIYNSNTDHRLLSAEISPNIEYVACGGTVGFVLYSITQKKVFYRNKTLYPYPDSFSFSADNKRIAIGLWNSNIGILNLNNLNDYYELSGHTKSVDSLDFSNDGKFLVSGSTDSFIKIWDIDKRKEILSFFAHKGYYGVESVKVSPSSQIIASAAVRLLTKENEIKLWELKTGKLLSHIVNPEYCYVRNISFSPNGKYLAAVLSNSLVKIWDISAVNQPVLISECTTKECSSKNLSQQKGTSSGAPSNDGGPTSIEKVRFSNDSNSLIGCGYGTIYHWRSILNSKATIINMHKNSVWDVRFTKEYKGQFFAIGEDGTGRYWETKSLKQIKKITGLKASNNIEWKLLGALFIAWTFFWVKLVIQLNKRYFLTTMTSILSLVNGLVIYDILCNMSRFSSYQILQLFMLGSIMMIIISLSRIISSYRNNIAYSFANITTLIIVPVLFLGMNFYLFSLIVASV